MGHGAWTSTQPPCAEDSRRPRRALCFSQATRAGEKGFPQHGVCLHMALLPVPSSVPCAGSAASCGVLSPPQRPAQQHRPAQSHAPEHNALPTFSCPKICSNSILILVRYCLYSLNSFTVQTTYGGTRAESPQNCQAMHLAFPKTAPAQWERSCPQAFPPYPGVGATDVPPARAEQAARGRLRRAGLGLARGMWALLLLPGTPEHGPVLWQQQAAAAREAVGAPLEEGSS